MNETYILTRAQIERFRELIGDIPTRFGVGLLNELSAVIANQPKPEAPKESADA